MHADNASVENAEALDWNQIRGAPVAEIGARTHAVVAAFNHAKNIQWVPDFVFRVAHGAAVFVEGHLHIQLLRRALPIGDQFGGLAANRIEAHLFCKTHDGVDVLFSLCPDYAIVDGMHADSFELRLQFLHGRIRHGVMHFVGGARL